MPPAAGNQRLLAMAGGFLQALENTIEEVEQEADSGTPHDPIREAILASDPSHALSCIDCMKAEDRLDLMLDPQVWSVLAPATEISSRSTSGFPGQKSQYNAWRRLVANPLASCRCPMVEALFQMRQHIQADEPNHVEATAAAVAVINERATQLHLDTREAVIDAVKAEFEKRLGNVDEDPNVTMANLKLQIEACKCLKKDQQAAKKKEQEEAKRLKEEAKAAKPPSKRARR